MFLSYLPPSFRAKTLSYSFFEWQQMGLSIQLEGVTGKP